jgi:hypothetical protein
MHGSLAVNASSTFGRRRGPTSLRTHHGGRCAPRDQGVRPTRRKLVNRHDRGGAPAIVPGTHATEGPDPTTRYSTRPSPLRTCRTASSVIGRAPPASAGLAHNARSAYLPVERIAFLPSRQIDGSARGYQDFLRAVGPHSSSGYDRAAAPEDRISIHGRARVIPASAALGALGNRSPWWSRWRVVGVSVAGARARKDLHSRAGKIMCLEVCTRVGGRS